ncbi:dihydrofolate synthase [Siphonobacter sp. BAB-5405]|uniref:bifunctional folylpolyglutamate synthase/dihydrofolate synthase n=1 Tax=Siphonobacter sp. BAB-5405 TaxID=1864825 RepID=UPI000C800173|nr:folylpolyglutamate synthase/dihydrofolate synthase family protein [Siphonobacter sp. BAB-5405]PMD99093.1 dihydrofolate synthase [Siphonobacter sp. BAB-5405]
MTYQETLAYLYQQLPVFHLAGKQAYKPGLLTTEILLEHLGNPHRKFKTIHVAGTNGKGSSSHMLSAILQEAGYKTGLYTSPHLKDYTERFKINGVAIDPERVVAFVEENRMFIQSVTPSFFELSVALAFYEFARQEVDVAVIEVGMGGRLDSTNVIVPEVALITNIGWDHADVLGDTLPKIAAEKAGIMKAGVPVVISERQPETDEVFQTQADTLRAPLTFASDRYTVQTEEIKEGKKVLTIESMKAVQIVALDLLGSYQAKNVLGVLETTRVLTQSGYVITPENMKKALGCVVPLTGLKGRWQQLSTQPLTYADTGHNEPGIREVFKTIASINYEHLWFVLGFVADKDLSKILPLYPTQARYVFCQASTPRALPAEALKELAAKHGLRGETIPDVNEALAYVRTHAEVRDLIVVGGSTFVVADLNEL